MNLQDGMLLFHGSYCSIENIDLSKCSTGKDFGRGFYLTSDIQQARDFINQARYKRVSKSQKLRNIEMLKC